MQGPRNPGPQNPGAQNPGHDTFLVCGIDGNYEVSQYDFNGNQWCVFPNNGSEIPNTRTNRHQFPVYCNDLGK